MPSTVLDFDTLLATLNSSIGKMADISGKDLWISGQLDNTARSRFEDHGWQVKENAGSILIKKD